MTGIATLDLARFRIDEESFLGQAVALGMRFRKLPEHAGDALLTYLRAQSMTHAARTRHGIALSKEDLERSVRQAMVCMELGLVEAADGDLDRAVDCIVAGDFDSLRKRGYQSAYDQLEKMRTISARLAEVIPGGLLKVERSDLERWGQLIPETWIRPAEEGENEVVLVDPLKEGVAFERAKARAELLVSLPSALLEELDEVAGDEGTWDAILRNLILALAQDRQTLVPEREDVARFESDCFEGGAFVPAVREKVLTQMEERLERLEFDDEVAAGIMLDLQDEIQRMESISSGLEGFFLVAGEDE
jgi:hypothetical protein